MKHIIEAFTDGNPWEGVEMPEGFDPKKNEFLSNYAPTSLESRLLWTREADSKVFIPVFYGGLVYFNTQDDKDKSKALTVVDAKTGEKKWGKELNEDELVLGLPDNYGDVVVVGATVNERANDRVMESAEHKERLHFLRHETGEEIFQIKLGFPLEVIAIENGMYYARSRLSLFGDKVGEAEKRPAWHAKLSDPHIAVKDGVAYVTSEDFGVSALDALSGENKWSFSLYSAVREKIKDDKARLPDRANLSNIVVENDTVIVGSGWDIGMGGLYGLDRATGEKKWEFDAPVAGRIKVDNGIAYFRSWQGKFYAVDVETGEKKWEFTGRESEFGKSVDNFAFYKGAICLSSGHNHLHSLDPETGKEYWHMPTDGEFYFGGMKVTKDVLCFGSPSLENDLFAMNIKAGEKLWKLSLDTKRGSYAVGDGVLYLATENKLHALRVD